ncbi:MAG: hypothetical protein WAV05_19275 [Anaerolineales bacterium]
MVDLLNPDQQRSVTIVLRMFEENLRQADSILKEAETTGILYHRKLEQDPLKRQAAQILIDTAYKEIGKLANELGLNTELDNPAGLISGQMSESWVNIMDSHSKKLKRFGNVDPRLEYVYDPPINHLAQLALALASIFNVAFEE